MKPSSGRTHLNSARLNRRLRVSVYVVFGLLWATGIFWIIFHYFLAVRGELGMEPNALEAWWLRLHGAAAFLVLWLGGLLWGIHVRPALALPRWRVSGIVVLTVLALLTITGYLLYYAGDEHLRADVSLIHWIVGVALALPLLIHILGTRSWRRRQRDSR